MPSGLEIPASAGMTTTLVGESWPDYGLMDCGHGRKLERYGPYSFIRPEPQAMWAPALEAWDADAEFIPGSDEEGGGRWQYNRPVPGEGWEMAWENVRFRSHTTPFRHLAFFPDMAPQWAWMRERLEAGSEALNLFGYTGVGTLAMSAAGASLVHVDASKKSVEAGKQNAALAGMAERPIRWIVEDAGKFVAREVRRGRRYDGREKCGSWRRDCPAWSPIAASCSMRTAVSWCSPSMRCACRRSRSASCSISSSAISAARSNAATWPSAKKRAGCSSPPRSSRGGPGLSASPRRKPGSQRDPQ